MRQSNIEFVERMLKPYDVRLQNPYVRYREDPDDPDHVIIEDAIGVIYDLVLEERDGEVVGIRSGRVKGAI